MVIDYALTLPVTCLESTIVIIILNYRFAGKVPYFDQQNQILLNDSFSNVRLACFFFNLYTFPLLLLFFFFFPFSGDT
jgi:hypothetical protein